MAYLPGQRFISAGGNTAGVTSLISNGTLGLAGGNNVTLSQNGNSISINAGAGGANFSAGTTSGNLASLVFSNSNGVNFGLNGNTITASHNGITSQSNQNLSLYALGNTTQNSSSLMNASALSFNAMGDLSIGYSNGSIQFSAATQTNMVSLNGSTGNISISGGPNITVGNNASTITISGLPMFDAGVAGAAAGGQTLGNNVTSNTGGLAFYAGSNVTLSQATGAGNASIIMQAGGGIALAGSNTTFATGTVNLVAGGGAITIGSGAQSLNLSVPATSQLVGINGITVSANAGTISISGPGGAGSAFGTVSNWEPTILQNISSLAASSYASGALVIQKLQPMAYVSASQLQMLVSMSFSTTNAGSHTMSYLFSAGVYGSTTGSQMTLLSSGSVSQNMVLSNGMVNANYSGIRAATIPININMSPGNYWLGIAMRLSSASNGTAQSASISQMVIAPGAAIAFSGPFGAAGGTSVGIQEGVGQYTAGVAAMPNAITMNQISQSNPRGFPIQYVAFKNMTW